MSNRESRLTAIIYWIFSYAVIFGGGLLMRMWQQTQHMLALRKAVAAGDNLLAMQLQHTNFANETWLALVMATLFVACQANAPMLRTLQSNGWVNAIKGRQPWVYVQAVTFILLGIAALQHFGGFESWVAFGLVVSISAIDWFHWRKLQQYREYYSNPANYLITR